MRNLLLPGLLFLLFTILTNAQSDVHKMLKDIEGSVDEIIIKSDGKEYTFSGDEAEKLFSSMKEDKKMKHFSFITNDGNDFHGDSLHKKIIIKKLGYDMDSDEKDVRVYMDEDTDTNDIASKMIEKKVIVSNDDGKKVVTITINEDGKEKIEVYEGKAADEYLDDMKSDKEFDVKFQDRPNCWGKKHKKITIEKEEKTE